MKSRLLRKVNLPELADYKVGALADKCEVSVVQLERYIFERTGMKAHEWLTHLRQMRVLPRLRHGSLTVKEAAFAAGYKQPSHFSREFKRFHGMAPSQV